MKWDSDHDSPDVIDRRGESRGGGGGSPIGGILPFVPYLIRSPFGWVVILAVLGYSAFRGLFGGGASPDGQRAHGDPRADSRGGVTQANDPDAKLVHFVSFVLDDVQSTWTQILPTARGAGGATYRHAKLVLFTDATETACGEGQSATGPFYCPSDERVYIDLGFYKELSGRFGAKGQFAEAYVVAHEIGHHVQKILGISGKVEKMRGSTQGASGASVRLELQADCFAGIWAHSTGQRNILEAGDIDSALTAAAAIGDDRLQKQATGTVTPEKWTHGSSDERVRWFKRGYEQGSIDQCDTFAASSL